MTPARKAPQSVGVRVTGSGAFPRWLADNDVSLAFTTYQAGKLFFVGRHVNTEGRNGPASSADLKPERLSVFERTFSRSMGLWAGADSLWMSSRYQVWRFENALNRGAEHNGYDRLYVPQVAYTTGNVDTHDLAVQADGTVLFVSSSLSCVATLSETSSLRPVWKPTFVSELAAQDRCHLNGLALRDGRARYVTLAAPTNNPDGWRKHRRDGGCVIDMDTDEVVASGLSMPHSPRWREGRLWVLNSGTGELGFVDFVRGRFEPVAFLPGFVRGLAFIGPFAIVGLSAVRGDKSFTGLELDERLAERGTSAACGLQIVDLRTGSVVQWLRIEGAVSELYDVAVLPGTKRPMALGLKSDEIERLVTLER